MRPAVFLALVPVVLAVGCGTSPIASGGSLSIATAPASNGTGVRAALLEGVLAGSVSAGSACLWVQNGAVRVAVQWPHGWSAAPTPLRVLDGHGHVVVRVGDIVSLTGGGLPDNGHAAYCDTSLPTFSAGLVERTNQPRRFSDYLNTSPSPSPSFDQCSLPVSKRSSGWFCYGTP